jgi:hypothetical protein
MGLADHDYLALLRRRDLIHGRRIAAASARWHSACGYRSRRHLIDNRNRVRPAAIATYADQRLRRKAALSRSRRRIVERTISIRTEKRPDGKTTRFIKTSDRHECEGRQERKIPSGPLRSGSTARVRAAKVANGSQLFFGKLKTTEQCSGDDCVQKRTKICRIISRGWSKNFQGSNGGRTVRCLSWSN